MRNYEFTVIFDADEEKFKKGLEDVTAMLAAAKAEITKQDDMGVRQLAYVIKKQDKGHYVYFEMQGDPAQMQEIERKLVLHASVLKYLFVNKSK